MADAAPAERPGRPSPSPPDIIFVDCSGRRKRVCKLQSKFLPQFLVNFGDRPLVYALAIRRGFPSAVCVTRISDHYIARGHDGRTVSVAIIPDFIIIRHNDDIKFPSFEVLYKSDDFVVAAVGGPRENASDPAQAHIAAARVLKVAVKNNNALERRMIMAPSRNHKGESDSRVFQIPIEPELQFRDPVNYIITVDEEDFLRGH
jgi:hypothetical protein